MHGSSPIRVIHVIGRMGYGGVQTWLMHLLRHADRSRVQMDFVVHALEAGEYDRELQEMGVHLHALPLTKKPLAYRRALTEWLRRSGPPDVVHSHVYAYSGWVLAAAAQAGVAGRVAHTHTDRRALTTERRWHRRVYKWIMRKLLDRHASLGLACSIQAAEDLYGLHWHEDERWQVLPYGLDWSDFAESVDVSPLRSELSVPATAFTIGHVGRMTHAKNHRFLLEVFAAVRARCPEALLVLVGGGEESAAVRSHARRLGIEEGIRFVGERRDVARVLRAFDVFVFPSLYEGLALGLVEAQAASLPCVVSEAVSAEADIVPEAVCRLPLSAGAVTWAEKVLARKNWKRRFDPQETLDAVRASPFNVHSCLEALTMHYESAVRRAPARRNAPKD